MPTDAGIEPRTVAAGALAALQSNALTTKLDLIRTKLDLIRTKLDLIRFIRTCREQYTVICNIKTNEAAI